MVNGVPISFEVDCGSGHSIIGYDLYSEHFSSVKLADPQLEMKTWSHQNLQIAGVFEATVQRKSFTASLPLIVLKESGQALLGRAWFHKLGIMVDILNKVPHPLPCPEILSTNLVSQLPSTPGQNLPPYLTEFQVPVDSETADKLTLTTHKGLFRVLRLCAGLEGVVVYIDDLLIQATHEAELIRRLRKVIQRMRSAGLRLKLEKCIDGDNLDYLGFHISTSVIKHSKEKIETLLSAPSPTDSLLSAELVVNETKADPVLIVVKSKILHRRLITIK